MTLKKRIMALALIALMAVAGSACAGQAGTTDTEQAAAEEQEYIGIISAMSNEVDLLLSEADIDHVDTIGGNEYNVGTLEGKPVVITKAGVGKVHAAESMTAMLISYDISRVIFTGIAGGVGDETAVLDEVIATRLVQHDYGTLTNDGFEWTGGEEGISGVDDEDVSEGGAYYYCDEDLVEAAYEAAVQVIGEDHVFKGTIATGDQFVASEAYVEKLRTDFDALACEMEGASIAAICRQYGTPFVVVRAMSDKADGKAHESVDNMGDIAADNSSRIVLKMLESL